MKTWQKRQIVKDRQHLKTDEEILRLQQLLDGIRQKRDEAVNRVAPIHQ